MSKSYTEALASTEETIPANKRREKTFTLYRIEPATITINQVIGGIARSLEVDAPTAIFGVHRDTWFHSRFTIVFKNKFYIEQIAKNGLQVGETKIAPIKPKPTRGYIPNLPIYASDEEVRDLLSNHGNVVGLYQRTREDGIRIGGWNFFIHLNERMQGKTKQKPITIVETAPHPKKTKQIRRQKNGFPFPIHL